MKVRSFSIIRLVAIYLLLALAGLTLVAVFVPQGREAAFYEGYYEEWWANALINIGVIHVFDAWYYYGAAGMIVGAIMFYAAGRLGRAFASRPGPLRAEGFSPAGAVSAEVRSVAAEDEIGGLLARLPFRWSESPAGWLGRRGRLGAVGTAVAAVGAAVVFAAAIARLSAPSEEVILFEGYGVALPPAFGSGYELRAEKIAQIVDPNTRQLLASGARLRLLRAGEEVAAGEAALNRPFRHSGLDIYHESAQADGARGLRLEAVRLKSGAVPATYGRAEFAWTIGGESGTATLRPREETVLGNTGLRFRYAEYAERFAGDENGYNDDGDEYNPVAFVQLLNARGDEALGVLFKNRPEQSFVRAEAPDFAPRPFELRYVADAGPWRAGRHEYLFASGAYLVVGPGTDTVQITMGAGEGSDLRARSLGAVVERGDGRREELTLPFAARVPVAFDGETYLLRFLGAGAAPVAALRVRNRADFTAAWIGGALVLLGLILGAAFRYEELYAYFREGKLYLAAGAGKADPSALERSAAALRGGRP